MRMLPVLLALAAVAPQSDEFKITGEKLQSLQKELIPIVEKQTGIAFAKAPTIRISTAEELAAILAEELLPQMRIMMPKQTAEEARKSAEQMAAASAPLLFAKFAPKDNTVHILPEAFDRISKGANKAWVKSDGFLRIVTLHELVHASDHQARHAFDRIAKMTTTEELQVWNAVIEGHAQFVAARVAAAEKLSDLFKKYEALLTEVPADLGEGEKQVYSMLASLFSFAYVEGKLFFDGLAATGKAAFIEDVFKTPPASKDIILHPDRYYASPKAAARDLKPLLDAVAKSYEEEWNEIRQKVGESEFRAACGTLVEKKDLDAVIEDLAGSQAIVFMPKAAPGSKMIAVSVSQLGSAAGAEKMYALNLALSKAKDEKMKEGAIRISKSEAGSLKTKGSIKNTVFTKTVEAQGQKIPVRDVMAVCGCYMIELLFSNTEADDKELTELLEKVVEFLSKEK